MTRSGATGPWMLSTTPPGEKILKQLIRIKVASSNNAFYKAVRELDP